MPHGATVNLSSNPTNQELMPKTQTELGRESWLRELFVGDARPRKAKPEVRARHAAVPPHSANRYRSAVHAVARLFHSG